MGIYWSHHQKYTLNQLARESIVYSAKCHSMRDNWPIIGVYWFNCWKEILRSILEGCIILIIIIRGTIMLLLFRYFRWQTKTNNMFVFALLSFLSLSKTYWVCVFFLFLRANTTTITIREGDILRKRVNECGEI